MKGIAAAVALTLVLLAGSVGSVLAAPEEGGEDEPSITQTTSDKPTTSKESSSSKVSTSKPSSDENKTTSSKSSSSKPVTSDDEDDKSTSKASTSKDTQTSRNNDNTTSKKTTTSKSGGGLDPDEKDNNSDFDDISWGAQYVEESSTPSVVSTAKPIAKDIDNMYAAAMKWVWLPILLICGSLFGLIAVNYRAAKQKRMQKQPAGRGRSADIPMSAGRPDRGADTDDDVFIASDTSMRPAKRTPPSHAKKKGPRRPRD